MTDASYSFYLSYFHPFEETPGKHLKTMSLPVSLSRPFYLSNELVRENHGGRCGIKLYLMTFISNSLYQLESPGHTYSAIKFRTRLAKRTGSFLSSSLGACTGIN